jgi:putative addiction module killer protein
MFVLGHEFRSGSSASPQVMPGMSSPLARASPNCESIYGPGYRVYFKKQGREMVILLAGGDKRTQSTDIKTAMRLARNL